MGDVAKDAFIFMKVGKHANETFEAILERKRREYERAGMTFWGYGGTACHPLRQVQPFARMQIKKQGKIYLLMEPINSNANPEVAPAKEYSEDGVNWNPIPDGIVVTGSRYALVLDEIMPADLMIPLNDYAVAIGPSQGKPASDYVNGRVDKGCFEINSATPKIDEPRLCKIEYSAQLQDPFAVLLR